MTRLPGINFGLSLLSKTPINISFLFTFIELSKFLLSRLISQRPDSESESESESESDSDSDSDSSLVLL